MSQRFDIRSTLAEHVRAACLEAALAAYEDAGIRGLCAEGRWEAALAAIRQLELSGKSEPLPFQARSPPSMAALLPFDDT